MKLRFLYFLMLLVFSCKNSDKVDANANSTGKEPDLEEIKTPAPVMGKLDEAFIKLADQQKSNPQLEEEIWHYTYALSLKETPPKDNIFKGEWLDLYPTGNYKKGLYKNTTEEGRFIYDPQTTLLELRSTANTSSEWKVKVDASNMILIGTSKYGNNPWQIKLSRHDTIPAE